jgi:molybdenum cofactor cytidylyltransferase
LRIVGILLAAGRGARFGGAKLLAALPAQGSGLAPHTPVGVAACRRLRDAVTEVVAIVRPGDTILEAQLRDAGARVVVCARADEGMGASLACGVAAARDADAWLVALGDMPWIAAATLRAVAAALESGAVIAAPFHGDERGHPVGFGKECRAALAALRGDEGAKSVIAAHRGQLVRVAVADPGILQDIDTPADLA